MARFVYNYVEAADKLVLPFIIAGGIGGTIFGGYAMASSYERPTFLGTAASMAFGGFFGFGAGFVTAVFHPIIPTVVPFWLYRHYKYDKFESLKKDFKNSRMF